MEHPKIELGRDVIFENFWIGNLSNSISTPNFIMIELETTKLGGEGVHNASPYCSVFKIAHTE